MAFDQRQQAQSGQKRLGGVIDDKLNQLAKPFQSLSNPYAAGQNATVNNYQSNRQQGYGRLPAAAISLKNTVAKPALQSLGNVASSIGKIAGDVGADLLAVPQSTEPALVKPAVATGLPQVPTTPVQNIAEQGQAKNITNTIFPATTGGIPQTSPKVMPLNPLPDPTKLPVQQPIIEQPATMDNIQGVATARQVQAPYTYPSGRTGANVNTLQVDNGLGGTGTVQFADGRKLSGDQQNKIQDIVQYNALPSTKEMFARQAAEVQARHDKNVAYDMANTPAGLGGQKLAKYNADREAYNSQQNAKAEGLSKQALVDAERYKIDQQSKTDRYKADKSAQVDLAKENNKPGFSDEELSRLPPDTPGNVYNYLKTAVTKPYVDSLMQELANAAPEKHDEILDKFAARINLPDSSYIKAILGGGYDWQGM